VDADSDDPRHAELNEPAPVFALAPSSGKATSRSRAMQEYFDKNRSIVLR
jgi:hypothetical protein